MKTLKLSICIKTTRVKQMWPQTALSEGVRVLPDTVRSVPECLPFGVLHRLSLQHRSFPWCPCHRCFCSQQPPRGEGRVTGVRWRSCSTCKRDPHLTAVSLCSSVQRDYEDSICFRKAEGEFSVTLRATLPRPCLSFPATVQLPVCAVHSVTETTFTVRNIG